jgi:SAM-dependent methyltransferase
MIRGLIWLIAFVPAQEEPQANDLARLIASNLKHSQGLALDVAGGDPRLAAALAGCTGLTVRCVDPSADVVARLRQQIDGTGLYGTRLTASQEDLEGLNFPSYSANLVIGGERLIGPGQEKALRELHRVLSPNGIAWVGQCAAEGGIRFSRAELEARLRAAQINTYEVIEQHGLWAKITRPREACWDEWTHRAHDPANSFGSNDTLSGTQFKPQWISDYRPGLSSAAVAVAGGRVVLASLSYASAPQTTPHIQVLDAYTGTELWARVGQQQLPIDRPPGTYSNRESCSDIAVVGDELYLLGSRFCHEFDLTSGKTLRA